MTLTACEYQTHQLHAQIAEDYACADLVLRLPGHAPMPAFQATEDVPLVVRHARRSRQQVRLAKIDLLLISLRKLMLVKRRSFGMGIGLLRP